MSPGNANCRLEVVIKDERDEYGRRLPSCVVGDSLSKSPTLGTSSGSVVSGFCGEFCPMKIHTSRHSFNWKLIGLGHLPLFLILCLYFPSPRHHISTVSSTTNETVTEVRVNSPFPKTLPFVWDLSSSPLSTPSPALSSLTSHIAARRVGNTKRRCRESPPNPIFSETLTNGS